MDTAFVDLDILLMRIRNPQSKTYFLEAVRAYKAGALRGALTSAWVALVYDLIAKYRQLSAMGDAAPNVFLQSWDNATNSNDISKLLSLEAGILDDATENTQIVNMIARTHLSRLRQDRHLCAHPAFSAEADLFEPSPELVRLHLVNAVELVLAQEPLQGKAIFELYDVDVQSAGFPVSNNRILDYVEQRYLARVRLQNVKNFGTILAKSLLVGVPAQWDPHHAKITASLIAVRDRTPASWADVSIAIVRLIDNLIPGHRIRAISFISLFPDFWGRLQESTRTALRSTIENAAQGAALDLRVLSGVSFPEFRQLLLPLIAGLDRAGLMAAIAIDASPELWERAIAEYRGSGGWRTSEANFRDLIRPFIGRLSSRDLDSLINAVLSNSQNWDAAETGSFLNGALRSAVPPVLPSAETRTQFCEHVRVASVEGTYSDVLNFFELDGWVPPPRDQEVMG